MPEWITGAFADSEALVQYGTQVFRALVIIIAGWFASRITKRLTLAWLTEILESEQADLAARGVSYLIVGLARAQALQQLGFDLSVIVGAAGVGSVAIGFASQTSMANLVSGLFVILERPFSKGDVISVAGVVGEVTAIDLLSTKIRTFDNLFVRVPNEMVIKSPITNMTRYPIRRYSIELVLGWDTNAAEVEALISVIADRNPHVLAEPAPALNVSSQSPAGITYNWVAWSARENWYGTRNVLVSEIREALVREGIELATDRVRVEGVQLLARTPES